MMKTDYAADIPGFPRLSYKLQEKRGYILAAEVPKDDLAARLRMLKQRFPHVKFVTKDGGAGSVGIYEEACPKCGSKRG